MDIILCRACLSTNSDVDMIPIDQKFIENYNLLTNLNITLMDGMPQNLCTECWDTVQQFIIFRKKCILSETSLRETVIGDVKYDKDSVVKAEPSEEKDEAKCVVKEELIDIKVDHYAEVDSTEFLDSCFQDSIPSDFEADEYLLLLKKNGEGGTKYKKKKPQKRYKTRNSIKEVSEDHDFDKIDELGIFSVEEQITNAIPCGLCPKNFDDKSLLVHHLESHKGDISCQYCFECFLDLSHILAHRLRHIPKNQAACPICWKRFRVDFYLEYHIRTMHCEDEFQGLMCKICSRKYGTPLKLRKHVRLAHSGVQHQCKECPKVCKSKQLLKSHMRVHSSEKKYICDSCGYSCKFPGTLKDHELRKHSLVKFECKHCSRMFNKQKLMDKHSCTKLFMCSTCGREFKQRGSYNRHLYSHSDERRYECTRCPAKYKSKNALQVHLNRHDGLRTKQCEYCSAKFFSTSVLIKHRRVHTGEKPYVCKVCKKGFTGRHNLKVHMKVHGEMLVVKKNIDPELLLTK